MKKFAAVRKYPTIPLRRISAVISGRVVSARHGKESPVRRILRGAPWQRKLTVGVPDNVHAQSSGRMRDKIRLTSPPRVQRQDDPDSPSGDAPSSDQSTTGRAPEPNELSDIGVHDSNFPNLTEYRILRERTYGFNCFAWAVGIEDRIITSTTISQLNYSQNLDGWTRYLMDNHGFVRYANGADTGADLVLFGESEDMVGHAARKAAHPYGRMTFSSKLGERSKTPVILHALADLEGGYYGNVLRSFWKAPDSEEQKSGEQTQPTQSKGDAPLRRKTMENETKEQIGSRQASGRTLLTAPQIERKVAAMQGGGQPLPASERAFFEPRFGHDFGKVRVHTGARAAESARAVNAQAFTTGRHVVLGLGKYTPGTTLGRKLLAHELTHVVQQTASGERNPDASEFLLQRSEGDPVAKGSASQGKTLILVAGGFNQFLDNAQEAAFLHSPDGKYWDPGTKDFEKTATDTQTTDIYSAKTVSNFFGPLQEEKGSIGRIVYIGHGAGGALGLSSSGDILNAESLSLWEVNIDQKIKPKLTESAIIDLYSCEAGRDEGIMNALAAYFGVCVRGFSVDLKWCIDSPPGGSVITSRGRWIDGSVDATDSDCDTSMWNKGVSSVLPPVKVCP